MQTVRTSKVAYQDKENRALPWLKSIQGNKISLPFLLSCLCFAALTLGIAGLAPINFSIAIVFLFAGPHNWVEFRYFLSRTPSRFGPLKNYFTTAIAGVIFLAGSFIALSVASNFSAISYDSYMLSYCLINTLLIAWVYSLIMMRQKQSPKKDWFLAFPISMLFLSFAWYKPDWFGLMLVYLHPLVGLYVLDLELKRKPAWRNAYRLAMGIAITGLGILASQLWGAQAIAETSRLHEQIIVHAGGHIVPILSNHMLVTTHTSLEMFHYGAWILAIPIVTKSYKKWFGNNYAFSQPSNFRRNTIYGALLFSSFAVLVLWGSFVVDYSFTRDMYFTLAVAHVLAEFPFLIRLL